MTADIKDIIFGIIASKIESFKELAENFGKSRFLVYKSEMHAPDESGEAHRKEDEEMEAIADSFRCEIKQDGGQFSLFFYMDERNPGGFLEIVDAGMPPPLAGGDNGTSRNPDGSTYPTPTPINRWNEPVPGYAKPATGVINEIHIMLSDLFRIALSEAIESSKEQISQIIKDGVLKSLSA